MLEFNWPNSGPEVARVTERLFSMPNGIAGPTAMKTEVTPVVQSCTVAMGMQERRPELRVLYVKLSGGNSENAVLYVGADRPGNKTLAERIIGVDGHEGAIGQTGGVLRLVPGG